MMVPSRNRANHVVGGLLVLSVCLCFVARAEGQAKRILLEEADAQDTFDFLQQYVTPIAVDGGKGPLIGSSKYQVDITKKDVEIEGYPSSLYIYTPKSPGVWPGIVFGHGLCGMVEFYENFLNALSSGGYVIVATTAYSDCLSNPFGNALNLNTTNYRDELVRNVKYMSEMENVNASEIALVGHSMGGGSSITAAAVLAQTNPGLVKAVVGISPWNGVDPLPSSVVSEVTCPILLICGEKDGLTPCKGQVSTLVGYKPDLEPVKDLFLGDRLDWNGGVSAIFGNISDTTPAILAEIKYTDHLATADTDGKMSKALQDWVSDRGLQFNNSDLPPNYTIPTAEYTLGFLDWAFTNSSVAYEVIWGKGILSDNRFVQVQRKNPPSET